MTLYIYLHYLFIYFFIFLKFKLHTKITDFIFRLFRVSGVGDQFFFFNTYICICILFNIMELQHKLPCGS